MSVPLALISPTVRLVAQGRVLAGYLTPETAATIPALAGVPAAVASKIQSLFGHRPSPDAPPVPAFRHVDEPDAVAVIATAAGSGGPIALTNLVGFEWIRIDGIVAGHYLAAPMPHPGRCPDLVAPAGRIAEYCVYGSPLAPNDIVFLAAFGFFSPEPLRFHAAGIRLEGPTVSVDYQIQRPPSPLTVWCVDGRVIAIKHQERLVALREAGVQEALCLVCYGYGIQMLGTMPTIEPQLLNAQRPPLIADFSDNNVAAPIPVHTPKTLVKFSHDVTDLTPVA
jgi:hypothetical protein